MADYPEKTCAIENLVRHPKSVEATLSGRKTQQRRDGVYAYPGDCFQLEGVTFTVTSLVRQTLGDMTDSDAQAEGYPDLDTYRGVILRMHKGMTWKAEALVWVHTFEKA